MLHLICSTLEIRHHKPYNLNEVSTGFCFFSIQILRSRFIVHNSPSEVLVSAAGPFHRPILSYQPSDEPFITPRNDTSCRDQRIVCHQETVNRVRRNYHHNPPLHLHFCGLEVFHIHLFRLMMKLHALCLRQRPSVELDCWLALFREKVAFFRGEAGG